MTTRRAFIIAITTAAVLASGCHVAPAKIGEVPRNIGRDTSIIAAVPRTKTVTRQISEKTVRTKRSPDILIATDNAECSVDADQFRETKAGERVTCAWSGDTR